MTTSNGWTHVSNSPVMQKRFSNDKVGHVHRRTRHYNSNAFKPSQVGLHTRLVEGDTDYAAFYDGVFLGAFLIEQNAQDFVDTHAEKQMAAENARPYSPNVS